MTEPSTDERAPVLGFKLLVAPGDSVLLKATVVSMKPCGCCATVRVEEGTDSSHYEMTVTLQQVQTTDPAPGE